ncbi:unnamed protein product [Spirodela intermedia]|uniref:Myb/SANT-like domain-containing protein n=1 Tax=Spirodela intermedia TaxID=51605 RepID=A0A7I8L2B0_SPIIN|nr:unnamed protein product [Spirodela intermedia]
MANEKVNASVPLSAVKSPDLKVRQRLKSDRVKAIWDDKKHAVFVRICLDQMRAGNKPHKTLNKLGYMNLEREFYKQTGFYYFKDQLKNHWDSTRRDWQAWTALRNQAGVGWDDAKGTYSQTEDWWASFAKRFPGGDKFAHHPLDHAEELDLLFGEGSGRSDGIAQSPPSSDATPSAATRDSQSDPAPESHGEAEEPDGLIVVRQNSARVEESGETAGRPEKRPRPSDGTKWEACMKQVCDILLGGSKLLASSPADDPASIANAMALLNGTYGVERNSEEWLFAVSKLRNESVRQLFLALGDAESRAAWIKREYRLAHG